MFSWLGEPGSKNNIPFRLSGGIGLLPTTFEYLLMLLLADMAAMISPNSVRRLLRNALY